MLRLMTDKEIIARYGNPFSYIDDHGSVSAGWGLSILESFQLPQPIPLSWGGVAKRISCHKMVKPELEGVFKLLHSMPEVWATINDYGGCFSFRRNSNDKTKLSRHSWAIALDLDVKDNPDGTPGETHPLIIQAFYDAGWLWGGWFSNPDPMHFEKAVPR